MTSIRFDKIDKAFDKIYTGIARLYRCLHNFYIIDSDVIS